MPFKSEAQRRYLWKNEPKIAQRWSKEYGSMATKGKNKEDKESSRKDAIMRRMAASKKAKKKTGGY